MRVALATDPGSPDWPNEDFAAVAPGAAVVLDGCTTVPRDKDTGCGHGVAWYARTLGGLFLGALAAGPAAPLTGTLAAAIADVRDRHAGTCDLGNPATPAATVTALRAGPAGIDLLALSDSVVMADYGDGRDPLVVTDEHRPAAASPDAAHRATTMTVPLDGLRGIALLSDGATRIVDRYHVLTWTAAIAAVREHGPADLIRQVRAAEDSDPGRVRWPRHKARDDATIVYWHQPGR
jgi:hypothetical protein